MSSPPCALPRLPSLRERAELRDRWLALRLEGLLPRLLRDAGVDAWIVSGREYAEDPVLRTMLPATWLSARRRTILLFLDRGEERGVERLAIARYGIGELFRASWDPDRQPDAWARVAELVREAGAIRIALNRSRSFAHADGLSASEHAALVAALGPELAPRLVDAEDLAVGWLETRIPEELERYPELCRLAHAVIREGLAAIEPGRTTTDELVWWYRERLAELALVAWFQPLVSLQRAGEGEDDGSFADDPAGRRIEAGDLLHVDLGLELLGLHTDTQHHAYVLRPGEGTPPAGLARGLALANRAQDLLLERFAVGRSGDELLRSTRAALAAEGIAGRVYAHPLGLHGHGAGPAIGLWDRQEGVPGPGERRIAPGTVWSIELGVEAAVPEWAGQRVHFMVEEDAAFDGERVRWLDGRQSELTPIGSAGGLPGGDGVA